MIQAIRRWMDAARRYPTIGVALLIILLFLGTSLFAITSIPFSEAQAYWSTKGKASDAVPRLARPVWTNLFRWEKLPKTIVVELDGAASFTEAVSSSITRETTEWTFDYTTTAYPDEVTLFYEVAYATKVPLLAFTWIKPDGSEIRLMRRNVSESGTVRLPISKDVGLVETFGSSGDEPGMGEPKALKGTYTLRAEATTFEEGFTLGGKLVVYGRVFGLAGTDDERRDLSMPLLWGVPIALMFGLLATLGTTILGFTFAAFGAWFGGWVDALVQGITEVSMMIPFFPTVLMVSWFFSDSLWVTLAFVVGLNMFSGAVKSYRAMFLQIVNAPYIEAARIYGASNRRIVFRYLIPQIGPVLLPQFIMGIPRFVFLEASLALLGASDPSLPTLGRVLAEGRGSLYGGCYYWVLQPAALLLLIGLSFSMLGYALDRVLNPRLRDT